MNSLSLKVMNNSSLPQCIKIDGKYVKPKKNKYGNYIYNLQSENEAVELNIYNWFEAQGVLWFLTSLLFFIISIFGIFDVISNKKCQIVKIRAKLYFGENDEMTMKYLPFTDGGKAAVFEGTGTVEELENVYFVDSKAKKRLTLMKFIKVLTFIGILAALVMTFVNLIING